MNRTYNYLAIMVSALVSFAIGFLWFTILFVEPYLAGLDKTQAQLDAGASGPAAFVLQIIGNLVLAFILAWLIKKLNYTTVGDGLKLSLVLWLGLVVAVIGPMHAFQAFSLSFFLINAGGVLLYLIASSTILVLWK